MKNNQKSAMAAKSDATKSKSSAPKSSAPKSYPIDDQLLKTLQRDLKFHAKALGIAPGSAEIFIDKSLKSAVKNLKNRKIITSADLTRAVAKELAKYHADLAYVFENYDKII